MKSKIEYKSNVGRVKYVLTEEETGALKQIGKILSAAVRAKAPRGATKKLSKNVTYSVFKKEKSVQVGVKKSIFYANFLEFGAKQYSPKEEHAFLKPAIQEKMAEVQSIIREYLRRLNNSV